MKSIRTIMAAMAFAMLAAHPVLAGGLQHDTQLADFAFGGGTAELELAPLGAEEMDATRGQIWALPLAIIGADIALAGFFWGVYVPYYSGGGYGGYRPWATR